MSNRIRSADAGRASGLISLIFAFAVLIGFAAAGPAAAAPCPNEALRAGPAAQLPDCRAYEQVSPVDKGGNDIALLNQAVAADGGAISYQSNGAFADPVGNAVLSQYLSRRGTDGWSTEALAPAFENGGWLSAPQFTGFAPDLSHQVVDASLAMPTPEYLYRRNPDGSFTLLNPEMPPSTGIGAAEMFAGASDDFSRIFFESVEALTDNAPTDSPFQKKLYRWEGGELTLVSVLPGNTPVTGIVVGTRAVSADGSRVYWQANPGAGERPLYLSEDGIPRLVSEGQSGEAAVASFKIASRDGSIAYLTSNRRLTEDASPAGDDLYRYDAEGESLVDLTPDTVEASVQGVVGASDDGGTVYFVALGALAAGATAGQPNLYVHDGSQTRFIATLLGSDSAAWSDNLGTWSKSTNAQVSPDGGTTVFTSTAPLLPGQETNGYAEIYRYQPGDTLLCVSCEPGGAPATGPASLTQTSAPGASSFQQDFPINNIAAGGAQVLFETTEALLPTDTNAKRDVYEWAEEGSGECQAAGGCLHLISTGRSGDHSTFQGASRSGEDVFILTRERLVGQDRDDNVDVYDARAGGGLTGQSPPPPPLPCSGEGCRVPAPLPGLAPSIGSASFVGPPTPKAKRKAHKPKRCKHQRKRGKNGKCKRVNSKRVNKEAK